MAGQIWAQRDGKKMLAKPATFDPPVDFYLKGKPIELENYIYNTDIHPKPGSENVPWMVINDRAGNIAYQSSSIASGKKSVLEFRESYYVIESKGEWLHIIRIDGKNPTGLTIPANANTVDMGWVDRSNMLLWREGLRDRDSEISLKCLLLNRADAIKNITKLNNKELVRIYDSPTGSNTLGEQKIYEIFYILKKENSRVLIAKDLVVGSKPKDLILGWVDVGRLSLWNTRMAIEPNFSEAAFNERKNDPSNRFVFFGSVPDVSNYLKSGVLNNVLFNEDPVKLSPDRLSKSNNKRYKGSVIRYPILANYPGYFGTGVIGKVTTNTAAGELGEMNPLDLANAEDILGRMTEEDKKVNIYFMIENCTEVNDYKDGIINLMNQLPSYFPQANYINYGCAIYSDSQPNETPIINRPLTQNRQDIISFVKNTSLYLPKDADKYTCFRYALKKVLKEGGWNPLQRNVIIVIGNGADFSASPVRVMREEGSQYYIADENVSDIYRSISSLGMNMLVFQVKNENNKKYSIKFREDNAEMLNESAKNIANGNKDFAQKLQLNYTEVTGPNCIENKFVRVSNEVYFSGIFTPAQGGFMSAERFEKVLNDGVSDFSKFRDRQMKELSSLIEKGNSIDATPGEFQPFLMNIIRSNFKGADPNTLKKFFSAKYQLFTEAYLPKKKTGSSYPLYSYVMFMPGRELKEYKNNKLKDLYDVLGRGSTAASVRQALEDALIDLVQEMSNQKSKIEAGDKDMDEALKIITGLNKEGVTIFGSYKNKKLGDLTKKGVWSDDDIEELADQLRHMKEQLDDIYSFGSKYEFSFHREGDDENIYFWIALDDLFSPEILR